MIKHVLIEIKQRCQNFEDPNFTYVILGNIILLFIVELIVQNLPKTPQIPSQQSYKAVERKRRKRIITLAQVFITVEIIVVLALFIGVLVLQYISNSDSTIDHESILQMQIK